jgi:predicted HTH domain antitoxin
MTDAEIVDLFDSTNITLAQLAALSGRTVPQLKKLLMGGAV